jgi:hypothetical protein
VDANATRDHFGGAQRLVSSKLTPWRQCIETLSVVVDYRQNQPRPSMHLHAFTAASLHNPQSLNARRGSWVEGLSNLHRLMEQMWITGLTWGLSSDSASLQLRTSTYRTIRL